MSGDSQITNYKTWDVNSLYLYFCISYSKEEEREESKEDEEENKDKEKEEGKHHVSMSEFISSVSLNISYFY